MIWVFYFKEMAKRFTDTEKWEDEWFTDLSNDFKVIWFYLLDTCDNAGIWKKNIKKLNYLCNTNVSTDDLLKVFGKRITILADEKWFINKFCVVQYGHDFLQSKNKAVLSAIKKLLIEGVQIDNIYSMNTLSIGYQYPTDTPKEQEQDKVIIKDKEMNKDKLLNVYNSEPLIEIENTDVDYMVDESEYEITRPMLERVIDKFIAVDNKFKYQSVIREIDEDYGGFDNLIELYLPNDISAQNNFKNKLNQYRNGIFA